MILILTTRSHEREVRIWVPSLIYIISDGTRYGARLSALPLPPYWNLYLHVCGCVRASVHTLSRWRFLTVGFRFSSRYPVNVLHTPMTASRQPSALSTTAPIHIRSASRAQKTYWGRYAMAGLVAGSPLVGAPFRPWPKRGPYGN